MDPFLDEEVIEEPVDKPNYQVKWVDIGGQDWSRIAEQLDIIANRVREIRQPMEHVGAAFAQGVNDGLVRRPDYRDMLYSDGVEPVDYSKQSRDQPRAYYRDPRSLPRRKRAKRSQPA